ncbi:unnamed protein product [Penicillium camemberti]|uniref:Str. FM013 n=1 Tax=Penicillium camemberti (strain FM 013) TaxID=1429867 RepID=A0A0G4NXS8_PENC3|nr:unnamed protein product [Penicillium camemberti]
MESDLPDQGPVYSEGTIRDHAVREFVPCTFGSSLPLAGH